MHTIWTEHILYKEFTEKFVAIFLVLCGLSAKDRGATKNPVSDLELNLSKTATKGIEFY